jgi:hypothetical protein
MGHWRVARLGNAVDAGRDGGEGDGFAVVLECEGEALEVATGEVCVFAVVAATPDRANMWTACQPPLRRNAGRANQRSNRAALRDRSCVGCMEWQEDADGGAVPLRFAIALDADAPSVSLDELL